MAGGLLQLMAYSAQNIDLPLSNDNNISIIFHKLYKFYKNVDKSIECCVCMEVTNINIYDTICKHKFCKNCLDEWLILHNNCPLCRTIIKKNTHVTPFNDSEDEEDGYENEEVVHVTIDIEPDDDNNSETTNTQTRNREAFYYEEEIEYPTEYQLNSTYY